MPQDQDNDNQIKPGDFYEDCRYHPMLAIEVDYEEDDIFGVSLVDGSLGHASLRSCGVVKLTRGEALTWKLRGPQPREWGFEPEPEDDLPPMEDPTEGWEKNHWWKKDDGSLIWPTWDVEKHAFS